MDKTIAEAYYELDVRVHQLEAIEAQRDATRDEKDAIKSAFQEKRSRWQIFKSLITGKWTIIPPEEWTGVGTYRPAKPGTIRWQHDSFKKATESFGGGWWN